MCHVMHVNESGRTDEWVMLHAWTSHTAHIDELCRTYKWVMSHRWMSHAAPKTQFEKLRKMKYFTKLRFARGMTHSCICATWKTKLNFSPSHTWMSHVTHVNKSRLTDGWVMSHIAICHVAQMNGSCCTYEWVMSHRWMGHVAQMNESCRG